MLMYKDVIPFDKRIFIFCLLVAVLSGFVGLVHLFLPLVLPYILFYLGDVLPFRGINAGNDISYGIYLYSFPIQQVLSRYGIVYNALFFFVISTMITVPIAYLSLVLVEKPMLNLKNIKRLKFV